MRLVGGRVVTDWKQVTDAAVLARLDESARGKVWQADLRAKGITAFGDVAASGRRLEFFFQDKPMTVARWPNEGFIEITEVLGPTPVDVRGTKGCKEGKSFSSHQRLRRTRLRGRLSRRSVQRHRSLRQRLLQGDAGGHDRRRTRLQDREQRLRGLRPGHPRNARGLGWAAGGGGGMRGSLRAMPYTQAPWSRRYPKR